MSRLENIINHSSLSKQRLRLFSPSEMERGLDLFLLFILLAFGFWLPKSLQQEYEIELVFPVKYKNVPADIAFNAPEVETITAKVKDKGSVLLNYTFWKIVCSDRSEHEEYEGEKWFGSSK